MTKPAQILLVEDTEALARLMIANITYAGYRVDHAASLSEAKNHLATHGGRFALAVVDLHLPDGSGLEVIEAFRRVQGGPAIALSADIASRCAALKAGARSFLEKPVCPDALVTEIGYSICTAYAPASPNSPQSLLWEHQRLEAEYRVHLRRLWAKLDRPLGRVPLRSELHQLKGSATLYGFVSLSGLAARLSTDLKTHKGEDVQTIQAALRDGIAQAIAI